MLRPSSDAETYERFAPELIRFATGLVGPSDAADVLSSAMMRAMSSPAWSTVANRRAYLYRVVCNEASSLVRRNRQRSEREVRAVLRDEVSMPAIDPEVRAAVDALSVRQRSVVLLTYWADLDPAGIALLLGISEGSVRRHLARARERLRRVLDG